MAASSLQYSSSVSPSPLNTQFGQGVPVSCDLSLAVRRAMIQSDESLQTYTPDAGVQQDVDAFRRVMQAQFERKEREDLSLDPGLPGRADLFDDLDSVDPVVQIVLENQYEDFGFPLYRVNYDDEEEWARWYEQFDKLLDISLEEAAGGKAIMDRLITYKVEDSELNHMPFQAVQE
jgi:HSP90 family molecular chaperone